MIVIQLSLHIRGPVLLKQVAIYNPTTNTPSSKKVKRSPHNHAFAHARYGQQGFQGHYWLHRNRNELQQMNEPDLESHLKQRTLGDMVTATIDGKVVSWTNEYDGPDIATAVASAGDANDSAPEKIEVTSKVTSDPSVIATSIPALVTDIASQNPLNEQVAGSAVNEVAMGSGSWARQAYYNAETGAVEGITFLNHFGGVDGIPGTAAGGSAFVMHLKQGLSGNIF